jgi:DNA invertase Pin-like site-specific DNA recombinase
LTRRRPARHLKIEEAGIMIVDGYVRVSQVRGRSGDSFMSPELQREQIERWAAAQGHHVAVVHVELDESGGRRDRPMLVAMMERVEAGVIDGVAVAKLDRFGRSLIDGLANIERIRQAGGAFVSVQDGLDVSTDTGKLVLRIMLSMAEWELDRIRSTWDNARRRAIERGMHLGSVAPFGYVHGPNRRLRVDPERARRLVELFKRRGNGATIAELQRYLEAEGVPTAHGGTMWRYNSITTLLGNRVYLGELRSGQHLKIAAHQPLVDEATWQSAQTPRIVGPRYIAAEPTLVIGLVRCASCGLAMQGIWRANGSGTYRDYRCPGISSGGRCLCRARARGWELEHLIEEAFFTLARQQSRTAAATNPKLIAKLTGAQTDLAVYRDHPGLLPRLGAARFEAGIQARVDRVEHAALAVAADRTRLSARRDLRRSADSWERRWPALTIDERRHAVAQLIECVFIRRGAEPLVDRIWFCPRGITPQPLPSRGHSAKSLVGFDPAKHRTVTITPAPLWPNDRIRRELTHYLDELKSWPSEQHFLTDGRGPLVRQVDRQGGQDAWARRTGHRWQKATARDGYWTEDRVRASLIEIMHDRDEWPFAYEWTTIAPQGLGAAITPRHHWWAAQLGYPLKRRCPPKRWTKQAIDTAVLALVQSTGTYPTQKQFSQARLSGLEIMIRRRQGHRALCQQLGLTPTARTAAHWPPPARQR